MEKKLGCSGISFINSTQKWLSICKGLTDEGKIESIHCGYADSEEEVVKIRDMLMLSKYVGPTADTHFPKKNYNTKKLRKEFIEHRKECGVILATRYATDISAKVKEGNLFSAIETIPTEAGAIDVKIICNGMPFSIGTVDSNDQIESLKENFFQEHYAQIKSEFISLRQKSIERFKEKPCRETHEAMKFVHGTGSAGALKETPVDPSQLLTSNSGMDIAE